MTDIKSLIKNHSLFQTKCFVGGKWLDAADSKAIKVSNPFDSSVVGTVPDFSVADTENALQAADKAYPGWRTRTAKERATMLRKWNDLILANTDDLATIMTLEQGKPLQEAKNEIAYAASFIEWYAEEGKRAYGETIPTPKPDRRIIVAKEPVGVVAAITPWNFPASMVTRKVAAAIAAGCTVVLKPSEETPYTALALAELASQAGFPAGVFNVVTGNAKTIGAVLTSSPIIKKLSFTGSTAVGKLLYKQCADTVKKISFELGGNAPFIIFEDANLEKAAASLIASRFRNAGQTCVCANRVLVQKSVYDKFTEIFKAEVAKLKTGSGLENSTTLGPLINEKAVEKVERLVGDAVKAGAKVVHGAKRIGNSLFIEGGIITGVKPDMAIAEEEIFGPVAALIPFENEAEALRIANSTRYGLAAYFFTENIARAVRVMEALEYGMVGVNEGLISTEVAPFGGFKESGLGREGSHHGLEEYLETKYVCIGGLS